MRIIALRCPSMTIAGQIADLGERQNPRCAEGSDLERSRLLQFGQVKPDDEIIIEATGNTSAIVRLLSSFVARIVIANPILVRAISNT